MLYYDMITAGLFEGTVNVTFIFEDESEETYEWVYDGTGNVSGSGLAVHSGHYSNGGEATFGNVHIVCFSWSSGAATDSCFLTFIPNTYEIIDGSFERIEDDVRYYVYNGDRILFFPSTCVRVLLHGNMDLNGDLND